MKRVTALLLSLVIGPAVLHADSGSAHEKEILELLDKGKTQAEEQIKKGTTQAEKQKVQPAPAPPQAAPSVEEDLITKLSRQVNSLRQKDAISKAQFASTERPKEVKRIGTNTVYNYKDGAVYEVHAGVDRITDIQLQNGESLSGPPVSGDTVRWKVSVIQSGKVPKQQTHIILKPLEGDIETNLILTTDNHIYHIRCLSSDWYMPSVSWNYPQEESAEYQALLKKSRTEEITAVSPEKLNFDYAIDGNSYSWKPLRVFDDAQKTYIQMPHEMRVSEAPVLFVIDDDEPNPVLVNYRVKGDYYIVDRLFENAELRVGTTKAVEIQRKNRRTFFERLF